MRPNILFIFLDELRADALGCYGHRFVRTPHIDRLAAGGVCFANCQSNNPLCVPTRVSLLTGKYSHQTGTMVDGNTDPSIPSDFRLLQCLAEAGYRERVNIGKHHTGFSPAASGFTFSESPADAQGAGTTRLPSSFDPARHRHVRILGGKAHTIIGGVHPGPAEDTEAFRVVDRAIRHLDLLGEEPWMLRVSINPPHTPVLPPEPWASLYAQEVESEWPWFCESELDRRVPLLREWRDYRRFQDNPREDLLLVRQAYYGLISFVDAQIGRLMDAVEQKGLGDNLLTILIADHGASIGDHGLQVKGPYCSNDITRVPMILSWPGRIAPGACYEPLVQLLDLPPTLLDLVGGEIPGEFRGLSLRGVLESGSTRPVHEHIFQEAGCPGLSLPGACSYTIRTPHWRYSLYRERGQEELIDLGNDPRETCDVSAAHPHIRADLRGQVLAWLEATSPVREPDWG